MAILARIAGWLKGQPVLVVSAIAALASMVAVPPNPAYAAYFNWHTLVCLFAMLAVLNAFRQIGAFRALASLLVRRFTTVRSVVLVLVMVTFFGSMFLTNDMALLTFLPLSAMVLSSCGQRERILFVFVMQTLAANLGGMILPFGNPQNLFLFSYYDLSLVQFVSALLPPFVASLFAIVAICVIAIKPDPIQLAAAQVPSFDKKGFVALVALFAFVIAMVFNAIPNVAGVVVVVLALAVLGRGDALKHVDYGLLATFACFFVFSGNLANIPVVQTALDGLLDHGAFLPSLAACQLISNVPAAILLAPFTQDWAGLLLGVDIGGLGTIVASLASLITLTEFNRCVPGKTGRFILVFTVFNALFLIALVALVFVLGLV